MREDQVVVGEVYTVTPHALPHGPDSGRWHCVVRGRPIDGGKVHVQEVVPDAGGWRRRMQTSVYAEALVPVEVQVDLFGNPVDQVTTNTRRSSSGGGS